MAFDGVPALTYSTVNAYTDPDDDSKSFSPNSVLISGLSLQGNATGHVCLLGGTPEVGAVQLTIPQFVTNATVASKAERRGITDDVAGHSAFLSIDAGGAQLQWKYIGAGNIAFYNPTLGTLNLIVRIFFPRCR